MSDTNKTQFLEWQEEKTRLLEWETRLEVSWNLSTQTASKDGTQLIQSWHQIWKCYHSTNWNFEGVFKTINCWNLWPKIVGIWNKVMTQESGMNSTQEWLEQGYLKLVQRVTNSGNLFGLFSSNKS